MDTICSGNPKLTRMFTNILSIVVIFALAFPATFHVSAATDSPFVGHWETVDVDGSDIRLAIGGPPNGPFKITWTESYISFCEGGPGIIRGMAWLNEDDTNLLEADLQVECFTTGASIIFNLVWRYHPSTNTLSSVDESGFVTIWHRPGGGRVEESPDLGMRVNYQENWVESFYEAGHTVWLTVTEADGVSVKATAEVSTDAFPEGGFNAGSEVDWSPEPPDIEPNDWVYGWVDNGASSQMQVGEINPSADVINDTVQGTISAEWFGEDEVYVSCGVWGFDEADDDMVLPDGMDTFVCEWNGAVDIRPGDIAEIWYWGPDGNAVGYYHYIPNPRIVASEAGDWFWTTEFNPGILDIFIYEFDGEGASLLWSGQQVADESGFTFVGFDIHGQDLDSGDYLIVSDSDSQKGLVLQRLSVAVFDIENEVMVGFAPVGSEVWAAAGSQEWQERIMVQADPVTGGWLADFQSTGVDITEEMREWSYAQVYDEDGDANEGSTPPPSALVIANQPDWVDSGITVSAGQSFTIEVAGLMNPCSDTYPNGAEYCIFYKPLGAESVVPDENEFGFFPGPGLRFMALLGRIDGSEPFYIGEGGTFNAEQDGRLWFTPNDNLRTDNQGGYSVLVWLEALE